MHIHQSLLLFIAIVFVCDACSCLKNCKNIEIKAQSEKTWHVGPSCVGGAGVKSISVASTDKSGFKVVTSQNYPDGYFLVKGSSVSDDDGLTSMTCWNMNNGSRNNPVKTEGADIFVTIRCTNLILPCPILYNIEFSCDSMAPLGFAGNNEL